MADKVLNVYSGRDAPELAPLYKLFEGLTGTTVNVKKIYHLNAPPRVLAERDDPQADLFVTNSQVAVEALRHQGVFEPYQAEVARGFDSWLRAPDYSWLSITAWPRSVMVNRQALPDPKDWPTSIEELTEQRFHGKFAIATVNEETTVSQVSSIRLARGDAYAYGLVKRPHDRRTQRCEAPRSRPRLRRLYPWRRDPDPAGPDVRRDAGQPEGRPRHGPTARPDPEDRRPDGSSHGPPRRDQGLARRPRLRPATGLRPPGLTLPRALLGNGASQWPLARAT